MPNSRFEGEYEDPSTQEYSDQGISFAEDEELPEQKHNLKVVSPLGFEPAEALSPDQLDAYLARFSVLFLDEHSGRRGGIGTVYFASNPFGERFAVKALNRSYDVSFASDAERRLLSEKAELLFHEEFECHKKLSGIKGFPKLYGYCSLSDKPALIMEWVEGISLRDAQAILSINDQGALYPIAAGRIGRDLFQAISRLSILGESVAHRDLSPANVMIRTSKASLFDQVDEGSFDICLIDFGSASFPRNDGFSFTENTAFVRKATPDYAPPEMLAEENGTSSFGARNSTKIDVYAGASILFELCSGSVPFDLGEAFLADMPFAEYKKSNKPRTLSFPHRTQELFAQALAFEPELAVSLELSGHDLEEADQNLVESVDFVDRQLADLLAPCLRASQADRPESDEMYGALASFCRNYYRNIELAYQGEPLIPCMVDGEPHGDADLLIEIRDTVRSVSKAASFAVLAVVLASVGLLTAGTAVSFELGPVSWQGLLLGFDVAGLLISPAVLGFSLSRHKSKRKSFFGGSFGVLAGTLLAGFCITGISGASSEFRYALYAALAATSFAGWCPVVMDYAMARIVPLSRRLKRKGLSEGSRLNKLLPSFTGRELPDSVS